MNSFLRHLREGEEKLTTPASGVSQGLARAVAVVRDRWGRSPDGACGALLGWLRDADNAGNAWDDSALTAARLEALASLRPASPQVHPPSPHSRICLQSLSLSHSSY